MTPGDRPVTSLSGVGPALAGRLAKLGIATVADLLFLLPSRYEDRTHVVPIGALRPEARVAVEGEIELAEVVFRRRRTLLVRLSDGTGFLTLRFFHFSAAQQRQLARGTRLRCFGEVRRGPLGLEIVHPEYRLADAPDKQAVVDALTPVYPATEGIQQGRLRNLTAQALAALADGELPELLPVEVQREMKLPGLRESLQFLHRPPPATRLELLEAGRHPAQRRLAFEELLAHQLTLRALRNDIRRDPGWPLPGPGKLAARLLETIGFPLTAAQERVAAEIGKDLAAASPMLRLVQGDVGSGKTIVAALAALAAIEAGCQVALMAPTELLAEQHLQNFSRWLAPLAIGPLLLTGRLGARARQTATAAAASGERQLIIGTHALFQEGVRFARLALVIVDEQHRFGVHQRLALRDKGASGRYPHQLIMTATPIPRTLAMTACADLDVSVIDELPPGRTPVQTVVMPDSRRDEIVGRIRSACLQGRQAYWVCPLIEESELLEAQAAEDTRALLARALPEINVGLVHGRMPGAAKERAMARFKT
ncbi:MAG: ATP-dependent DNA helicase RecG, partial [Steroidobacteraceae bacterium]